MKPGIHPDYVETTVVCSCGNRFTTNSTSGGELHIELCNQCHPFFTGQQKFVDTGGRVQRFSDKFGSAANAVLEKEAAEKEARRKAAEEAAIAAKQAREAKEAEKAAKAATFEAKAARKQAKAEAAQAAAANEEAPATEEAAEAPVAEEAPAEESAE
ncbi:MAG: 50S ribosomal protein L31 [Coriobacteriia bacterium]|nr:50S ribosomal protein L31 [Coriobacteriia bacterium]